MKKILFATIFSALLFSCSKSENAPSDMVEGQGQLSLALSADASSYEVDATKADSDIDVSEFQVDIYKDAGDGEIGSLVVSYEDFSAMPTYITLDEGDYVVTAKSMELIAAGFDAPYYYGKQRVQIESLTVGSAEITCALENVKLTVGYSETFINQFESFKVIVEISDPNEVADGEAYSLEFDATEEREAYFMVTDLRLIVDAVQKNGEEYSDVRYIENPQAKDYYNVTYDITAIGESSFTLVVDKTTNNIDHDVLVPSDDEDLGDGADPDEPDYSFPPTVVGDGFDIDEELEISTSADIIDNICQKSVVVKITASSGIANLNVTIDADDIINSLAEQLFGCLSFDLANLESGSTLETELAKLGLCDPEDPIKDKTSHSFDITAFVGLLTEGTTNYFYLDVTDNNGKTTTKTVTIKRVP